MTGLECCLIPPRNRQINPLVDESQVPKLLQNLNVQEYRERNSNTFLVNSSTINIETKSFLLSAYSAKPIRQGDVLIFRGESKSQGYLHKKAFLLSLVNRIYPENVKQFQVELNLQTYLPFPIPQETLMGILGYKEHSRSKVKQIETFQDDIINLIKQYSMMLKLSRYLNWENIHEVEENLFNLWKRYNHKTKDQVSKKQMDLFSLKNYFEEISLDLIEQLNLNLTEETYRQVKEHVKSNLRNGQTSISKIRDSLKVAQ